MAIEDAIYALNHTMKSTNVAVAEIIRQRDEAVKEADQQKRFCGYAESSCDNWSERAQKAERSNAALRGAMKRMKKARKEPPNA